MTIAEARFWSKVVPTGFCWEWHGSKSKKGYGQATFAGKNRQAHRVAYELLVGPIPEGLTLDHICRAHHCVNPDHLEPVTSAENVRRYWATLSAQTTPLASVDELAARRKVVLGADGKMIQCCRGHRVDPSSILLTRRSSGSIRTRCAVCQHECQNRNRRKEGRLVQGKRGAYGPRDYKLFEEYWGFTYADWLSGDVRPVDGGLKLVA